MKKRNSAVFSLFVSMLVLTFVCGSALAADPASETVPIKITSDNLEYDPSGQSVTFTGSVHVVHPDAQVWADTIEVELGKRTQSAESSGGSMESGQIERIFAKGNVRIVTANNQKGECGRAEYAIADGVLTMKDNPVLRDGDNSIGGEIIRFYTKENRSEVIGSSKKPVEALFSAPKRLE